MKVNSSHLYGLPKYGLWINYSNLIQEFNRSQAQLEARSKWLEWNRAPDLHSDTYCVCMYVLPWNCIHMHICLINWSTLIHYFSIYPSCTSPCTAPLLHPAPVMAEAHPMAKQRPTEPPDHHCECYCNSEFYLLLIFGHTSLMKPPYALKESLWNCDLIIAEMQQEIVVYCNII